MTRNEAKIRILEALENMSLEERSEVLHEVINAIFAKSDFSVQCKKQNSVPDILKELGIPTNLYGYQYLIFAINYYANYMKVHNKQCGISSELYPAIAKEFNTTSSRAERAMRHAIETAWERGNIEVLHEYFRYSLSREKGKTTNSEFISTIAEKLVIEEWVLTPKRAQINSVLFCLFKFKIKTQSGTPDCAMPTELF